MDEMGRHAERILHGTGETTMSVTEEARRVLGQHRQSARRSWGPFTDCTCGQWKGHSDMYLAHMVDALAAAGVLAAPELPQAAAEPGATLASRIRALGNTLVSDVKVDLGPLVREAERLEAHVDLIEQRAAGWPSTIQAHTERERRVRELIETIASEWPDRSGVIQSIVVRLREALDPTTPDRK